MSFDWLETWSSDRREKWNVFGKFTEINFCDRTIQQNSECRNKSALSTIRFFLT